jgi:hypothetical protein
MYRRTLDLAGRSLPMITIHVKKRYGSATVCSCVTAPTIEQALLLAGEGARVVFPIDGETFFASANYPHSRLAVWQMHPRAQAS